MNQDLARYLDATPKAVHDTAKKYVNLKAYTRVDIVPGPKSGGAE